MSIESRRQSPRPADIQNTPDKEKEPEPGVLIVITGGTASGKTSLAKNLLAKYPHFSKVLTVTTREMRIGEVNKVDYLFITQDEFDQLVRSNAFVESQQVYGNSYGTLRSEIEEVFAGRDKVWLVDNERGLNIAQGDFFNQVFGEDVANELLRTTIVFFVDVPDRRVRRDRFMNRESLPQTPDNIQKCKDQLRRFLKRFREELPGLVTLRALATLDPSNINSNVFMIDNSGTLNEAMKAMSEIVDRSRQSETAGSE